MDFVEIVNKTKKEFPNYPSLFWGILFLLIFSVVILEPLLSNLTNNLIIRYSIYALLVLSWLVYWQFRRNNFPRNKDEKIGLILLIKTENDNHAARLKNDFISNLKELIENSKLEINIFNLLGCG